MYAFLWVQIGFCKGDAINSPFRIVHNVLFFHYSFVCRFACLIVV